MDFGLKQDLKYTKPTPHSPPPPTPFRKGSRIQRCQKGTPENTTLAICTVWAPYAQICAQVFVSQKIIPAVVWFFLPVKFHWQPHTSRNLKQVAASNLQNSTGEKIKLLVRKSYRKPPIFTLAFLQYCFFLQFICLGLQCESTNSAETFCYGVGSLNAPTIAGLGSRHS